MRQLIGSIRIDLHFVQTNFAGPLAREPNASQDEIMILAPHDGQANSLFMA